MKLVAGLTAIVSSLLGGHVCLAQGVTLPFLDCYYRCPHPNDVNPCCSPDWRTATCTRFDSAPVIVYSGDIVYLPGEEFEFRCENCCKFEPDECPGNYANPESKTCAAGISISYSESIELSVSAGIQVGIENVELTLESGVGVTLGSELSVTLNPVLAAPKCTAVASQPRITVRANRVVRVDHMWQAQGVWKTLVHGACLPGHVCPIAGKTWIVSTGACGQDSSTAKGNKIMSATDGSPYPIDCPTRFPCN